MATRRVVPASSCAIRNVRSSPAKPERVVRVDPVEVGREVDRDVVAGVAVGDRQHDPPIIENGLVDDAACPVGGRHRDHSPIADPEPGRVGVATLQPSKQIPCPTCSSVGRPPALEPVVLADERDDGRPPRRPSSAITKTPSNVAIGCDPPGARRRGPAVGPPRAGRTRRPASRRAGPAACASRPPSQSQPCDRRRPEPDEDVVRAGSGQEPELGGPAVSGSAGGPRSIGGIVSAARMPAVLGRDEPLRRGRPGRRSASGRSTPTGGRRSRPRPAPLGAGVGVAPGSARRKRLVGGSATPPTTRTNSDWATGSGWGNVTARPVARSTIVRFGPAVSVATAEVVAAGRPAEVGDRVWTADRPRSTGHRR